MCACNDMSPAGIVQCQFSGFEAAKSWESQALLVIVKLDLEEVIAGLQHATGGHVRLLAKISLTSTPKNGSLGISAYPLGLLPIWPMLTDLRWLRDVVLQRIGRKPFTRRGTIRWNTVRDEAQAFGGRI